jgi:Tol biopolymer transport system component
VPAFVLGIIALAITGRLAVQWFAPSLPPLSSVPLTSDPGYEFGPRLSPDGAQVAYARGTQASEPDLVVQGVGPAAQPQVVARRAFSAAWSPTGQTLAVLRSQAEDSTRRDVLLVGLSQQPPRRIAEVDTPGAFADGLPSTYLDFSPDGRFLVASDGWGVDGQSYLVLIAIESGEKFALTSPDRTSPGDFTPRFSPDGRRIAFTRILRPGVARLHVLDLTTEMRPAGPSTEIAAAGLWNAFPAWTADSRHLVFAGGVIDNTRLKLVRVSGTSVMDLPLEESGVSAIDLRPGGRAGTSRLVYTRSSRDTDIFRVSIDSRRRTPTPARSTAIIESTFIDELPRYSPDGSRIAFLSGRSGSPQVWLARADGTEPRQLTRLEPGAVHIHGLQWSPDGRRLALAGTLSGKAGIHEVDAATGTLRPLVGDDADLPVYSPDGQWLYFRIARQRAPRIWRVSAQGGTPELIETLPGTALQFTPDGGTLVYARGVDVLMRPASGGHLTQLFSSIYSAQSFAVTGGAVYAVARQSPKEPWSLVATHFQDRSVQAIATFERGVGDGISVSPDEQHALFTQAVRQVLDMTMTDEVNLARYLP